MTVFCVSLIFVSLACIPSVTSLHANRKSAEEFEGLLRLTHATLPKGPNGRVGPEAASYALRRMFARRNNWLIRGLEGLVEQRVGRHGADLGELAALAVSVENHVNKENAAALALAYKLLGLSIDAHVDGNRVREILDVYMMVFLTGGDFSGFAAETVAQNLTAYADANEDYWFEAQQLLRDIERRQGNPLNADSVEFAVVARIVDDVNRAFGAFNEQECNVMKSTLLEIRDRSVAGRVRLADFYRKGLQSTWKFHEKADYLRRMGALDESYADRPRVILANYVGSHANCLHVSGLHAICCPNACDALMTHIEGEILAPMGEASHLANVTKTMAPHGLSENVLARLDGIAEMNDGQIPLHGRLFGQWMHHAFPQECPQPSDEAAWVFGEWTSAGREALIESIEARRALAGSSECRKRIVMAGGTSSCVSEESTTDTIPWSDVEVVFAEPAQPPVTFEHPVLSRLSIGALASLFVLWRLLGRHVASIRRQSMEKVRLVFAFVAISVVAHGAGLVQKEMFLGTFLLGAAAVAAGRICGHRNAVPAKKCVA